MKAAVYACACMALLSLALMFLSIARTSEQIRITAAAFPASLDASLAREGAQTREVLDKRLAAIQGAADAHLTRIEDQTYRRIDDLTVRADAKLDRALVILDQRTGQIAGSFDVAAQSLTKVAGMRDDIKPTVDAVNQLSPALMRNALGTVAAVKITAGETAQTMKTVRDAAPAMTKAVAEGTQHLNGIAADAHAVADRITKPQRWYQKLWSEVKTAAMIGAHFL